MNDRCAGNGWQGFTRAAPLTRGFNHLISGTHFAQKFGRWPLPPADPRSTVNDLIFARMIDPHWTDLQCAFVDKIVAKDLARQLLPNIGIPETLAAIPMDDVRSVDELYRLLGPFIGADAIAKPAHASGAVIFLRDVTAPMDLALLFALASVDYATVVREMQYHGLPRRIIVESIIASPTSSAPDDYKFQCVHGEPLLCQIDHARFGEPWSRLFRVPGFAPMHAEDGFDTPEGRFADPERLVAMTAAARILAAPFDYVRVDLYDGVDGIYFGELTFTPAASLGIAPSSEGCHRETATHREYSRTIMDAWRRR